jgi:uncharacterized protein YgfB (UPF0149 family)
MMPAPDYEELDSALSAAAVELSTAEAHGLITGAASSPQPPRLAELLFGQGESAATPEAEQLIALGQALQDDVQRRLEESDFEFEPMLGDAELPTQLERVAAWSRGYVLGLATGGLRDPSQLRGDAGEFLRDVMRIGEVEMDEDDDANRQQRDLAEVLEYLRVGVQLVYEELRGG